jgi:DNA ligase (NAD+)
VQAKIGELKHFVQTTEIDGFGDVLLEKLYTSGLVTDASEFYELKANELLDLERMGETLANKLVANVEAKRELPLDVFLRSLGIREVGKHTSTILAERYGTLDTVMKVTKDELSAIHTIGDVIAEEVVEGLKAKMHLIEKMLRHVKIPPFKRRVVKGGALSGKSVLFTGTLTSMVRSDASKLAEAHGATIASGVSKVLDYLIVGDGGGAGSKLDKAKKLQAAGERVQILTESEFKKMVE